VRNKVNHNNIYFYILKINKMTKANRRIKVVRRRTRRRGTNRRGGAGAGASAEVQNAFLWKVLQTLRT
jgi:hypothetical protein